MKLIKTGIGFLVLLLTLPCGAAPTVRVKDIAHLLGVRNNQLSGIGLVTGVGGQGDSQNSSLLKNVLANMLGNFDVSIDPEEVKSKNCAVVMISAEIPPFVRPGDRIDLTVSSIGDAKNLAGGILLQTNLKAANGSVYATAQGRILISSSATGRTGTVGTIPGGGTVEREVLSSFLEQDTLNIVLKNPDFVTANSLARAVSAAFPGTAVNSVDAALVEVTIPAEKQEDLIGFIAELESLTLTPDVAGKVVIDTAADIIILGENVRIGKVAVSYKQINVSVGGNTTSAWGDEEESPDAFVFPETTSAEDFVNLLREVGLKADIITGILQAIEKAGALYGSLILM